MANLFALLRKVRKLELKQGQLERENTRLLRSLKEGEQLEAEIAKSEEALRKQLGDLQKDLDEAERSTLSAFERVAESTGLARRQAQEAPKRLEQVCRQQRQALSLLLDRLNGTSSNSSTDTYRPLSLRWEADYWTATSSGEPPYLPLIEGLAPSVIRVGEFVLHQAQNSKAPALLPIRSLKTGSNDRLPGHIVIFSDDADSRQSAVRDLEAIALRAICTFPVRKLQGIFIDPVSMGDVFPFKSLPNSIVGQQTYTRSDDVQEQLRKLTVHTQQVIQNYLSRDYDTLEEYNSVKSSIEEAYRYLFVADFPKNFSNQALEDLRSLLSNGSRAGVYAVLHINSTLEKPRNFDYSIFDEYCTVLRPIKQYHEGSQLFEMQLPKGLEPQSSNRRYPLPCKLILDQPPTSHQFNQLTALITEAAKQVKTETVSFSDFYPQKFWSKDSRQIISAPIGITGAREKIEFWMGENEESLVVSGGLLAGKPGAGKSYTLHAIILSLAMQYSPDELQMYLLDFKEGVEFQIYVDPNRSEQTNQTDDLSDAKALPHARVISIESDREFGLSVLQNVQKEIENRGSLFKTAGVSELNDYRTKTGTKLPRILVVIDEFQYMFQENDAITQQLNLLFEDITRRGRAFGVHLLIASQSPSVRNMSSSIYSFIPLRMAMQMDQNTAISVLAEGNTDSVDLLDRSGRLIYNAQLGKKGGNTIGQVADVSLSQRKQALHQIQSTVEQQGYQRQQPLVLFNGNRPTKLRHNAHLAQLVAMNQWATASELKRLAQESDWMTQEYPGIAWLGEAMRIGNHTRAIFRRRPRSNLLMIGSVEEAIFGILGGCLLSLVHSYSPQQAEFYIMDFSYADDDGEAYWTGMTIAFRDAVQPLFPVRLGKRFPDPQNNVARAETILSTAYAELERRRQYRAENPDELQIGASVFLVVTIGGLNRAQMLCPVMGKSRMEMSPDAQKLLEIAEYGSELGIHLLLWLDSTKTFLQLSGDSRAGLTHFDLRVALQMPADDSRQLLGETFAQNLPAMRAYFSNAASASGLEKFKPYAVPSDSEIWEYGERLKHRH